MCVAPILTVVKLPGYLLHGMSLRAVMEAWKVKVTPHGAGGPTDSDFVREAHPTPYRNTSLIRNSPLLGPYSTTLPRVLWWS